MNWWLRKLLADYRQGVECRLPTEPITDENFEEPCETCRATDAVLAETWQPLEWGLDGPLVAEVESGKYATIEQGKTGWAWRVEIEEGWETKVTQSGTAKTLADALYAAERAARGL